MKAKTFVATPIYGPVNPVFHVCWSYFNGCAWDNERFPIVFAKPVIGESLVPRARNHLSRLFLESDCTHLLFIDSDMGFRPEHVQKLLEDDLELVGGLYCQKDPRSGQMKFVLNGLGKRPEANGCCEVRYVGTGFLLIARRVFELMLQHFGSLIEYVSDFDHVTVEHDFWSVGVRQFENGTRRYLSEDWMFCQRWRDLGGKVYVDTHVLLEHHGSAMYPLEHQAKAFLELAQKADFPEAPGADTAVLSSPRCRSPQGNLT